MPGIGRELQNLLLKSFCRLISAGANAAFNANGCLALPSLW